jgi:hypothetical protein
MFSILSGILGFATSGLPSLLDYFKSKGDQSHEREMTALMNQQQLAMAEKGFQSQEKVEALHLEGLQAQAFADEKIALYQNDSETFKGASKWIINLRSSVRPVVTYLFVALLLFVDIAGLIWAIKSGVDFATALNAVFSETEEAILTSIIGFWFGSQAFSKK